jgi:hypothetical protein
MVIIEAWRRHNNTEPTVQEFVSDGRRMFSKYLPAVGRLGTVPTFSGTDIRNR